MKFKVRIGASKTGSIGTKYVEKRIYEIESPDRESVNRLAIERAYQDGDIEHVRVEKVEPA